MPVSKKRKKKKTGKPVQRGSDRMTGLTLQDLINVVAYQEYKEAGVYDDPETKGGPDDEMVVINTEPDLKVKENEDGR